MSAQLKTTKKKYTQHDLRRLMQEQKSKTQQRVVEQKIESPLAKYNDQGQLTCILCKSVVRSEPVWKVHINTKVHKANVEIAKQLKEQLKNPSTNNNTISSNHLKRPNETPSVTQQSSLPKEKKIKLANEKLRETTNGNPIPSDFFDNAKSIKSILKKEPLESSTKMEVDGKDEVLPEGFFDDPIKDAKIRNLEYKDPQDEEWDRFQREIREEATLSNAIIAGEQEEATAERQIKEIDEQIQKWSKVLDLEKKKEVVSCKLKERPVKMDQGSSDEDNQSDGEDEDDKFDEFPDWRAKKFHR